MYTKKFPSKRVALASLKSLKRISYFEKIELKGIGFKLFSYKNFIAFDLGTSNLLLLKNKRKTLQVKLVKNSMFIFSKDLAALRNFCGLLTSLIKVNKYKGKGVFNSKTKVIVKSVKIK